jgi:hypothetical protein
VALSATGFSPRFLEHLARGAVTQRLVQSFITSKASEALF